MADMNLDAQLVVYARQSQAVVYLTGMSRGLDGNSILTTCGRSGQFNCPGL